MLRPRPNDAAEAGSVIENLPYFWFHVSNKGVVPTHPVARSSKVVFLHGFMQSHTAWLTTAARIRDKYGHESLLLDFYGHGNSPYPSSFDQLSVGLFVQQLRRTLERVGWQDEKLVFAAISLGAAVALRYNELYPNSAERFLLFAPSTKAEPFPLNLANVASVVAKAGVGLGKTMRHLGLGITTKLPPIFKSLAYLNLIKNTPTYDTPQELKHVHVPFTVLLGQLDCIHTAQAEKWRKAGIPSLNQTIVMPYEFHVTMCHNPARFKLEDIVNAWHCRHLERRRDNNGRKNLRPSNVPTSPPTLDQYKTKNVSSIRSRL
eukprot:jgi/Bigna1/77347/fgenesh1_pg.47_\